ncbi:MAG: polysaccharide deacetylase family protein [Pseudomonadota bacterium]
MKVFRILLMVLAALMAAPSGAQEPASTKRIAFTFDDVPRAAGVLYTQDERTRRLIEGLKEAGVEQAAFFLNPKNIPTNKGAETRIAAYVDAGHVIANHTFSHPWLSQVTAKAYLADLDKGAAWFEGREGTRQWFRFPFLDEGRDDKAKRDAVREGLAERGLTNAYVTVDASDWFYEGALETATREGQAIDHAALSALFIESHVEAAEFYADLAERALGRQPAHVMLMHENDLTALTLVDLVDTLKAKGWRIITVDEAYADPVAVEASRYDTPSAGGTLIEQLAWQKGLPAPRWYSRNDTRLAQAEFRKRVLGGEDN